jgi:transposase
MEATGAYWEALTLYLHELKYRVSVVNWARIKAFAQSELLRTKTDAVDAALIARFCKSQDPEPWIPPPPEIRILQALMRHYEHLKTTRAQQSVYAQSSQAAIVTASIAEVIGIPHLDRFQSAKAVAAFAGLSPRERRSGTSIHGRAQLCKTGNARVRKALYMPAMVALRIYPAMLLRGIGVGRKKMAPPAPCRAAAAI